VPYLKRVAIAHKLHHSEKYDGVPWGLFLGPLVRFAACPFSFFRLKDAWKAIPFQRPPRQTACCQLLRFDNMLRQQLVGVLTYAHFTSSFCVFQELEKVGGGPELDRMVAEHNLASGSKKR